ncbi:MAG: hypothetical protein OIN86_08560 [Candidatus Methanoperedens sp.]|nr:hypothetical protein [Candidatus Methanoperedens sp.]CAG0951465.1 hypothetical protein METP1_00214 [Methanosarcinales archaeon]
MTIGIIYQRLNYLALGSIIAITKNYVDKVFVILDKKYDDISEIALAVFIMLMGIQFMLFAMLDMQVDKRREKMY